MFKIKIIDEALAKEKGVKLENPEYIWVSLEEGIYTDEKRATVFINSDEAAKYVYEWEAIVRLPVSKSNDNK